MAQADISKGFRVGDNLAVRTSGTDMVWMEVIARDQIFVEKTLDEVVAGGTVDFKEITELNPPEDELLQIDQVQLMKGNVKLLFKQPGAVNRFGTERSSETGFINDKFDTLETQLFIMNNLPLNIKEINDTPVSITPVVKFLGHRYQFRKLRESEIAEAQKTGRVTFVNGTGIGR